MSRADRNQQASARKSKLNRLSLLGAGIGAVAGFLVGLVNPSAVIPLSPLLGVLNGAIGGVLAVLLVAVKTGLENKKPRWWYLTAAIAGGLIGQVVITKLLEWLMLLVQWVLETGGLYGIFIFD